MPQVLSIPEFKKRVTEAVANKRLVLQDPDLETFLVEVTTGPLCQNVYSDESLSQKCHCIMGASFDEDVLKAHPHTPLAAIPEHFLAFPDHTTGAVFQEVQKVHDRLLAKFTKDYRLASTHQIERHPEKTQDFIDWVLALPDDPESAYLYARSRSV